MPPVLYHIGRAMLVALIGTLTTIIIGKFDTFDPDEDD
jgi:hypothetical protein